MKIALIGSKGQLGFDILRANSEHFNFTIYELPHEKIEVSDFKSVDKALRDLKPDVVINTAAFHKVDECETYPDMAFKVNTIGARNVAIVSNLIGASVVFISTDYVFDGKKSNKNIGYTEFDTPNPLNVYGKSKLEGEIYIKSLTNKFYIIRTSWLFGSGGSKSKGGNFVLTMMRLFKEKKELKIVSDQIGTPTNTYYLAMQILELIKEPLYGVYHISCEGMASWFEFANEIKKILKANVNIVPISTSEYPTKAKRPPFSALENFMLNLQGMNKMPHWKDALYEYLKSIT